MPSERELLLHLINQVEKLIEITEKILKTLNKENIIEKKKRGRPKKRNE